MKRAWRQRPDVLRKNAGNAEVTIIIIIIVLCCVVAVLSHRTSCVSFNQPSLCVFSRWVIKHKTGCWRSDMEVKMDTELSDKWLIDVQVFVFLCEWRDRMLPIFWVAIVILFVCVWLFWLLISFLFIRNGLFVHGSESSFRASTRPVHVLWRLLTVHR